MHGEIPAAQRERPHDPLNGYERRRRIEFLLNVLRAPTGVWRPVDKVRAEARELIEIEFGE
jgi:hypothetical protein